MADEPKAWDLRKAQIAKEAAAYAENRRIELESPDRFYFARMFSRLFGGVRV